MWVREHNNQNPEDKRRRKAHGNKFKASSGWSPHQLTKWLAIGIKVAGCGDSCKSERMESLLPYYVNRASPIRRCFHLITDSAHLLNTASDTLDQEVARHRLRRENKKCVSVWMPDSSHGSRSMSDRCNYLPDQTLSFPHTHAYLPDFWFDAWDTKSHPLTPSSSFPFSIDGRAHVDVVRGGKVPSKKK